VIEHQLRDAEDVVYDIITNPEDVDYGDMLEDVDAISDDSDSTYREGEGDSDVETSDVGSVSTLPK
jgi:hypothetical protein